MKIKTIDRIFLIILTLFAIVLAIGAIMAAWQLIPSRNIVYTFSEIVANWQYALAVTIASIILIILSAKLLFLRIKGNKTRRPPSTIIKATEFGVASLSYTALESMILKQAKTNQSLRDCKCMITVLPEGTAIHLAVSVLPGTNLVELVADLQQSVKENIETLTGLTIKEVSVTIESADAPDRPAL